MSKQRTKRLEAALRECIEVLALAVEPLPWEDPVYGAEVKELGDRIGYGALMSSASASWRKGIGALAGGEYAAGPCVATVQGALAKARKALDS